MRFPSSPELGFCDRRKTSPFRTNFKSKKFALRLWH